MVDISSVSVRYVEDGERFVSVCGDSTGTIFDRVLG